MFAVLAEDVLDSVRGTVVLLSEFETAFPMAVLADDVEFGVDGEFALGTKLLIRGCLLTFLVDGAVRAFGV